MAVETTVWDSSVLIPLEQFRNSCSRLFVDFAVISGNQPPHVRATRTNSATEQEHRTLHSARRRWLDRRRRPLGDDARASVADSERIFNLQIWPPYQFMFALEFGAARPAGAFHPYRAGLDADADRSAAFR